MFKKHNTDNFDERLKVIKEFHGFIAPGVVLGSIMVDAAYENLSRDGLFDAISETERCLPDAIQLFTPCTIGNNWLRVFNYGRFALIMYDKISGQGVRISVDSTRLDQWDEIKSWFFKLKPKKEQNTDLLIKQILTAGKNILRIQPIKINLNFMKKDRRKKFAICPICLEAYPAEDGPECLACKQKPGYVS